MTVMTDFNAEEWSTLVEAPLFAGMRVAAAERGGTIRESLAAARTYADARRHQGESEFVDAITSWAPALDARQLQETGGDIAGHARRRIDQAVALVDAKAAPQEAAAYKRFVLTVAEAAANANREGGFIGIGGKPVSADEQAALDDIRRTLSAQP